MATGFEKCFVLVSNCSKKCIFPEFGNVLRVQLGFPASLSPSRISMFYFVSHFVRKSSLLTWHLLNSAPVSFGSSASIQRSIISSIRDLHLIDSRRLLPMKCFVSYSQRIMLPLSWGKIFSSRNVESTYLYALIVLINKCLNKSCPFSLYCFTLRFPVWNFSHL